MWSVPVFWPRSSLRYTLAYLLSTDDGAVLVDTGWPTDTGWESLVEGVEHHVLPRISPHIGLDCDEDADPFGRYLASLAAMAVYDPDEVLPAHEYRFTGLGERVANLLTHHQARLAEIELAVAAQPGASTWRVAEMLTWSRGWERTTGMTRRAAVSETLAHLVHLRSQQRAVNDATAGVDAWRPGPRAVAGWQ